ncbi:winged helix-turn-helix transcriptional regulator [Candidatus Poribacteria bacterium]|nr:winged helix-turn-helix transcriptional regulator [Candidatus Poribacteria bacterium]
MNLDCTAFFKAISDPTRIKIMMLLREKEMCVSDICQNFKMKQPSISHHLNILKTAKIVVDRKDGKEVYYKLNKMCVCSCCDDFVNNFKEKK